MEVNWYDVENITLNHPLISSTPSSPSHNHLHPYQQPPTLPHLMHQPPNNQDVLNIDNFMTPNTNAPNNTTPINLNFANATQTFIIVDENNQESIEPVNSRQKLRGRPAGSKNKPKLPMIVEEESPDDLQSLLLEITSGNDIIECITTYVNQKHRGVTVMWVTGIVKDVTLRQLTIPDDEMINTENQGRTMFSIINLPGRYEILSLRGTFLPKPSPKEDTGVTIYLAGGQGQVLGGNVVGKLMTFGRVRVVATSFSNALFERLPESLDSSHPVQIIPQSNTTKPDRNFKKTKSTNVASSSSIVVDVAPQPQHNNEGYAGEPRIAETSSMPLYNLNPPNFLVNNVPFNLKGNFCVDGPLPPP
ncbi:hypothetical protein LIER_36481 [Lithospermum erythrorhizon]|uniref:PPC domain-containing protein n=1 Tax=Lithospermum erythrorhizon TaxID=34254 RepID=A0AAV3P7S8_LITER